MTEKCDHWLSIDDIKELLIFFRCDNGIIVMLKEKKRKKPHYLEIETKYIYRTMSNDVIF